MLLEFPEKPLGKLHFLRNNSELPVTIEAAGQISVPAETELTLELLPGWDPDAIGSIKGDKPKHLMLCDQPLSGRQITAISLMGPERLTIQKCEVLTSELVEIGRVGRVVDLDLSFTILHGETEYWVQEFPYLEKLSLTGTRPGNRILDSIAAHPVLTTALLCKTDVTQAKTLWKSKSLSFCDLWGCTTEESSFEAEPHAMRFIGLAETGASDSDLLHLARWPRLESLNVRSTKITNTGLQYLVDGRSSKEFRILDVSGCALTNEAIPLLVQLKPKLLKLKGTKLNRVAIDFLRDRLPDSRIVS